MKERILQFINAEQISSTQFADTIGVQRSSVSHILSGRNNPSFDFIRKILSNYPAISAEWLILGVGNMYKEAGSKDLFEQEEVDPVMKIDEIETEADHTDDGNRTKSVNKKTSFVTDIERVVIFYSNNTFTEYHPQR